MTKALTGCTLFIISPTLSNNRFVCWDLNQINWSGANNSITDANDTTYDKVSDVVES